ncbi:hypothetical protein ANO14919_129650 [Xylariales sp. No.14919]|nr:hypothetical protein F5X98DRAFT_287941 [Xylaria grammica]GAW23406.1 hypothetical protein ANO14919_129650 [Xylariales sp. No.14919]
MEYQTPTPSFQPSTFAVDNGRPSLPPPPPPPQLPQQQQQQQQQQFEPPPVVAEQPFVGTDLKTMRTAAEMSLREYASLQKQGAGPGRERLRAQGGLAASDLRALRSEVAIVLKTAQANRWRKWLLGGIVAAIIPAVRKIFRRSSDDKVSSNDTEHAFRKSKSLIARILDSVRVNGKSGFASIAFFVLAVLYVFQSEVSLRVARTVSKRLKTLVAKVEDGVEDVGDQDLKLLSGWRWRVLLW